MSDLDFTDDERAFLRSKFEAWKAQYTQQGVRLAHQSVLVEGLRELIVDHDYGLKAISDMIGVSRERVRQWADEAGIERSHRGSSFRVFDHSTNRFKSLTSARQYSRRKITQGGRGAMRKKVIRKRRRIAKWVLQDLAIDLERIPGHTDLADAYCVKPSAMSTLIGVTSRGVATGLDDFWRIAGFTRPRYNCLGRGRPDREHKPIPGRSL